MTSRHINVRGSISAISYPGVGEEPVVSVMLTVGEQSVVLAFLGRTDIHGFQIGSKLHVKGMLSERQGLPTVFNPRFSVLKF